MTNCEKIVEYARIAERVAELSKGGSTDLANSGLTLCGMFAAEIGKLAFLEVDGDRVARAS